MPSVLVPLAQGCEELEAVTIIDLLRRANIDVVTAALDERAIVASRGTGLTADTTLATATKDKTYDMVALPGGLPGADHLRDSQTLRALLRDMAQQGKYTAAICAAPKVLAHAGLLEGRNATCYPNSLSSDELKGVTLKESAVVQDGTVITSRGPGTAMDFALHLIEILTDKATRDTVENGLVRG